MLKRLSLLCRVSSITLVMSALLAPAAVAQAPHALTPADRQRVDEMGADRVARFRQEAERRAGRLGDPLGGRVHAREVGMLDRRVAEQHETAFAARERSGDLFRGGCEGSRPAGVDELGKRLGRHADKLSRCRHACR